MSNVRFKSGDVTETLIKATEIVGEFGADDAIVLLYRKGVDGKDYRIRFVCSDDITIETANWLFDKGKHYLLLEED